jgi:hypothetical protein
MRSFANAGNPPDPLRLAQVAHAKDPLCASARNAPEPPRPRKLAARRLKTKSRVR